MQVGNRGMSECKINDRWGNCLIAWLLQKGSFKYELYSIIYTFIYADDEY